MQKKQFGRSMIEMLGVLAIIGVLSIGGLLGYRRAVNNHQANVILDDVNRFAFVILERSGLELGEVIPKGDFKESGIYDLRGYQSEEAQGFSITVQNVPKGVCEALLPKAVLEYKVGIVTAGGSVDDEIVYDTLHKNICNNDVNDVAFYFGDTSDVCNEPDESGYTPCTTNSDCCGEYFCVYANATNADKLANGNGQCESVEDYNPEWATLSDGQQWLHSRKTMNGWTAYTFCEALGLKMTNRAELDCSGMEETSSCANTTPILKLVQIWGSWGWQWLDDGRSVWKDANGEPVNATCVVRLGIGGTAISGNRLGSGRHFALCH